MTTNLSNITILEYFWLDNNNHFRSKTRICYNVIFSLNDIPEWNYDGSSTSQTILDNDNTEIIIKPVAYYKCPFRKNIGKGLHYIVLCDTWDIHNNPIKDNKRPYALEIFNKYTDVHPWYGYEQEYFIFDLKNMRLNGKVNREVFTFKDIFNKMFFNEEFKQGSFYCGNGGSNILYRELVDKHMEYCIYAGIRISGTNMEVAPNQFEFQIGPIEGIDSCDQLITARFILDRLSEEYGLSINYYPKPFHDYNGSGCHTNFSTESTRNNGGFDVIINSMNKFKDNHLKHMEVYGEHNDKRMTGMHETSNINDFTFGIGTRHTSIRIGNDVLKNDKGYFEDRRPASNMNPYLVASIILETFCQ